MEHEKSNILIKKEKKLNTFCQTRQVSLAKICNNKEKTTADYQNHNLLSHHIYIRIIDINTQSQ